MGRFSRRETDEIFLIFPENWIRHFMQIVTSLHKMSNPVFSEKWDNYFNMSSAENFTQSAKHLIAKLSFSMP